VRIPIESSTAKDTIPCLWPFQFFKEKPESMRKTIKLYAAETTLGWRVVREVPLEQGLQKESAGAWRRVLDPITHELAGFQLISGKAERIDKDLSSIQSSSSISGPSRRDTPQKLSEMEINAGQRSSTVWLNEEEREERAAAGRPPEDRAERVQAKVAVYAHLGAAKGDILRVWPRGENRPPLAE
jgi:hypothetical protein